MKTKSIVLFLSLVIVLGVLLIGLPGKPGAQSSYQSGSQVANEEARRLVRELEDALKSGNPEMIRQAQTQALAHQQAAKIIKQRPELKRQLQVATRPAPSSALKSPERSTPSSAPKEAAKSMASPEIIGRGPGGTGVIVPPKVKQALNTKAGVPVPASPGASSSGQGSSSGGSKFNTGEPFTGVLKVNPPPTGVSSGDSYSKERVNIHNLAQAIRPTPPDPKQVKEWADSIRRPASSEPPKQIEKFSGGDPSWSEINKRLNAASDPLIKSGPKFLPEGKGDPALANLADPKNTHITPDQYFSGGRVDRYADLKNKPITPDQARVIVDKTPDITPSSPNASRSAASDTTKASPTDLDKAREYSNQSKARPELPFPKPTEGLPQSRYPDLSSIDLRGRVNPNPLDPLADPKFLGQKGFDKSIIHNQPEEIPKFYPGKSADPNIRGDFSPEHGIRIHEPGMANPEKLAGTVKHESTHEQSYIQNEIRDPGSTDKLSTAERDARTPKSEQRAAWQEAQHLVRDRGVNPDHPEVKNAVEYYRDHGGDAEKLQNSLNKYTETPGPSKTSVAVAAVEGIKEGDKALGRTLGVGELPPGASNLRVGLNKVAGAGLVVGAGIAAAGIGTNLGEGYRERSTAEGLRTKAQTAKEKGQEKEALVLDSAAAVLEKSGKDKYKEAGSVPPNSAPGRRLERWLR